MSDTRTPNRRIITPVAILSYPWIANPQPATDDDGNPDPSKKPTYSGALIFIPEIMARFKQYGTSLQPMQQIARAAAIDFFGDKLPALMRNPLFKSGFRTDCEDKGYAEGCTYVNARNQKRPGAVYLWPDPTTGLAAQIPVERLEDDLYPGALVRASLGVFGFDKRGNKGVSWALNNLQLIDGTAPRLDGRKAAEEEFEADATAAPASLEDETSE